ncbi:lumican [Callorhinchus milii]|nr:lumican [Callorhinchus milii]
MVRIIGQMVYMLLALTGHKRFAREAFLFLKHHVTSSIELPPWIKRQFAYSEYWWGVDVMGMGVRFLSLLAALFSATTCADDYSDYGGLPVNFNREDNDPSLLTLSGRISHNYFRPFGIQGCPSACDCPIQWLNAIYCDNRDLGHVPFTLPRRTRYLYVQGNRIQHLPAAIFSNTTELKWLVLDRNEIGNEAIGNGVFSSLSQLENLYMNHNNLTEVPTLLPGSLKDLRLAHNRITNLSSEPFRDLVNLTILLLQGNQLSAIDGNQMKGLKSIVHLDLSNNHLAEFPENLPVTIQQLYCSRNALGSLPPGCFAQFERLLYLRLGHNSLDSDRLARDVFNVSSLIELDLGYNNFTSVPLVHQNLRYLYIEANRIDEFNVTSFCRRVSPVDYSQMRILRLDGNKLTYNQLPSDWIWCLRIIAQIYI